MLSFHQRVLRKFIFLFSLLFFILGTITYYWSKEFYLTQTKESLLNTIEIISFDLQDKKNHDLLGKKIKESLQLRLTIVAQNGLVLTESHKNKKEMDNHKYRDEIIQAQSEPYGYQIRHSDSINKDLLYIAKKYTYNNTIVYIRLAKELKSINEQILWLGVKIFIVLSLFFIVIFFIVLRTSKEIEKETKRIVNFLSSLTKKQKSSSISSSYSLEFAQITKLLTKVSQILTKKEKQKSKYTARLQVSNQEKDDIISAISHEFKNPIAVINGYSQTLLEDEKLNFNTQKKFLTKIHKNGLKLTRLIDTLRLSVKLDSTQPQLNIISINLHDTLLDTVENLKVHYPQREILLEGHSTIFIKADSLLFGVILSNLVENALKYSEKNVHIIFDENSLKVVDTGIGISQNDLQNITNKFYRVHENTWNNSLGLGLFLVKNIVKLHKFKLEVISKENEGSTFSIYF